MATSKKKETPIRLHNGVTYVERQWRELPMYQCPNCAYNNVVLEDFARHQALVCRNPECPIPAPMMTPDARRSPVVDRFGNPVLVPEEGE